MAHAVAPREGLHGLLDRVLELLRTLLEVALGLLVSTLLLEVRRAGHASSRLLDLSARPVGLVPHLAPPGRLRGRSAGPSRLVRSCKPCGGGSATARPRAACCRLLERHS